MNLEQYRHQIPLQESTLSYLDIGQGPVVLLGHAYLWDATSWGPQLEMLSQHYRCIVPDLWGHGLSGAIPKSSSSLVNVSQDMLDLMDALAIEEFVIIGQSVGGMWATELALLAPSRVKGLVLINTFIGFEPEVTREKYMKMLNEVKAKQSVSTEISQTIAPLFFCDNPPEQPIYLDAFRHSLSSIPKDKIPDLVKMGRMIFGRRDTTEYAEQLTLPCLILAGVEDKIRTVLEGYLMQDVIDASQFEHIQAAGHMATLEQVEPINQKISRFLQNIQK